jgi:hypothetical protein
VKRLLLLFGFPILCLALSVVSQVQFDRNMNYDAAYDVHLTIPSARYVKLLSFGYHDLLADFIYLWSIQFYSSYNIHNMYDYLEPIFNLITELSPKYSAPYKIGSLIMANEAKNIQMALKLLKKGAAQFPEDWTFNYDIAFYYFKSLNDPETAKSYFHLAAQAPLAPAVIKLKEAHMIYLQGDSKEAFSMWLDIYQHAHEEIERLSAFNHLYQIKFEVDEPVVERALAAYQAKYGHFPTDLEQLVRARLLQAVPTDFAGNSYQYDPGAGKISTKRRYKVWKKSS